MLGKSKNENRFFFMPNEWRRETEKIELSTYRGVRQIE